MYRINEQGEIYQSTSVKQIESYWRWSKNVWTCTEKQGILVNDSVESDCRGKSVVNEADDL